MKNLFVISFFISFCFLASFVCGEESQKKVDIEEEYSYLEPLITTEYITIEGEPVRLEDEIDLRGKDLRRTRINNITLSNIDFSDADLSFADLSQTRFFHCNFQGANLEGAKANEAIFRDCKFLDARVKYAQIPISPEQFVTTHEYKTKNMFG